MDVSGQLHGPAALALERKPQYPWRNGWVGPRVGLDDREKRKIYHTGKGTQAVQHLASPYID